MENRINEVARNYQKEIRHSDVVEFLESFFDQRQVVVTSYAHNYYPNRPVVDIRIDVVV